MEQSLPPKSVPQMHVPVLTLHEPRPLQLFGHVRSWGGGSAATGSQSTHTDILFAAVMPMTSGCCSANALIGGLTKSPGVAATAKTWTLEVPAVR
eukprot:363107-Chlamydomonas_euryale.AAC.2